MGKKPAVKPIRLEPTLMKLASQMGSIMRRSVPKQIEYWADLGRLVENTLDQNSILAILQGSKRIKLEDVYSEPVDPEEVFKEVSRVSSGEKKHKPVTSAKIYYEASANRRGYLDRVDSVTKERRTGKFKNGKFEFLQ